MFLVLGLRVLRFVDLSFILAMISDFDLDIFCLDVVTGVWYTYVPNFAIYLDFYYAKSIHGI